MGAIFCPGFRTTELKVDMADKAYRAHRRAMYLLVSSVVTYSFSALHMNHSDNHRLFVQVRKDNDCPKFDEVDRSLARRRRQTCQDYGGASDPKRLSSIGDKLGTAQLLASYFDFDLTICSVQIATITSSAILVALYVAKGSLR